MRTNYKIIYNMLVGKARKVRPRGQTVIAYILRTDYKIIYNPLLAYLKKVRSLVLTLLPLTITSF